MSCKICNAYKVKSQYRNLSLAIVRNTPNLCPSLYPVYCICKQIHHNTNPSASCLPHDKRLLYRVSVGSKSLQCYSYDNGLWHIHLCGGPLHDVHSFPTNLCSHTNRLLRPYCLLVQTHWLHVAIPICWLLEWPPYKLCHLTACPLPAFSV